MSPLLLGRCFRSWRKGRLIRLLATAYGLARTPSGYIAGTRNNAEGTDVNRTFGRGGTTP